MLGSTCIGCLTIFQCGKTRRSGLKRSRTRFSNLSPDFGTQLSRRVRRATIDQHVLWLYQHCLAHSKSPDCASGPPKSIRHKLFISCYLVLDWAVHCLLVSARLRLRRVAGFTWWFSPPLWRLRFTLLPTRNFRGSD